MKSAEELLQIARAALADIALSDDMTLEIVRKKAFRIYEETAPVDEQDNTVNDG